MATAQASDFNVSDFDVSDFDVTANLHMRNDFHGRKAAGAARASSVNLERLCKRITQSQRHQNPKIATGTALEMRHSSMLFVRMTGSATSRIRDLRVRQWRAQGGAPWPKSGRSRCQTAKASVVVHAPAHAARPHEGARPTHRSPRCRLEPFDHAGRAYVRGNKRNQAAARHARATESDRAAIDLDCQNCRKNE